MTDFNWLRFDAEFARVLGIILAVVPVAIMFGQIHVLWFAKQMHLWRLDVPVTVLGIVVFWVGIGFILLSPLAATTRRQSNNKDKEEIS